MVFKFETFVKVVVLVLAAVTFSPVHSDTTGTPAPTPYPYPPMSDPKETDEYMRNIGCFKSEELKKDSKLQERCDRLGQSMTPNGGSSTCASAEKDYNDAKGEFDGACNSLPSSGRKLSAKSKEIGEVGDIACTSDIIKCSCRFKNIPPDDAARLACSSGSSSASSDEFNLAQSAKQFANCPALAAVDIDRIENELKERKKDLRELRKKIPELEEGLAEAQNQADEKVQEAKKQMVEAAKAHGEAQKEARREKEEAQNQLAQQLLQLQEEITKLEEQRGEIRLQRTQANVKRIETISAIELNCHKSASDKVDELQKTRLALEQARGYNRGGFAQMMRAVGVSDRDAWQRVAKKYYDWCIQSTPTRKAKEAANKIYETEQKAADERDRDLDRKRSDIANRMTKIKSNNGCTGSASVDSGGESTESALCQAARRATEEAARIDQDYINQRNQLAQQAAQAQMSGMRASAAKSKALAEANGEINDENTRLRNLERFLALKRKFSGGKRITAQDLKDAQFTKFGALVGKAKQVLECKFKGTDPASVEACAKSATCYEAINFLAFIGDKQASEAQLINTKVTEIRGGGSPAGLSGSEGVKEKSGP